MIRTDTIEIDGNQYMHTWSDAGRYVCRDGEQWDEAIDPLDSGRVYTEGDYIDPDPADAQEILDILLGGSDDN